MIKMRYNCPEDVANMPKSGCGHFCDVCAKNVYDFRGKSKEEAKAILKNDPSINCGIFDDQQISNRNRSLIENLFRIAFAAVFVLGFNASMLFGQDNQCGSGSESVKITKVEANGTIAFSGTMYTLNQTPLAGAHVSYVIDGESTIVETDENGKFNITLSDDQFGKSITFYFSHPGYGEAYYTLTKAELMHYVAEITLGEHKYSRGVIIMGDFIEE